MGTTVSYLGLDDGKIVTMPPSNNHPELEKLEKILEQNAEIVKQNNEILRKMYRYGLISFWLKIFWYAVLIGMPFALYFYVLEPYFNAFGSSYDNFIDGLNELPGLRGIEQLFNKSE